MARVLLLVLIAAAALPAFALPKSYKTNIVETAKPPQRSQAVWTQAVGSLFWRFFGDTRASSALCDDLLFIPEGQDSRVLNETDVPVNTCISQRKAPVWWTFPFVVSRLQISTKNSDSLVASDPSLPLEKRKPWILPHMLPQSSVCKWWLLTFELEVPGVCERHHSRPFYKAVGSIPDSLDYEVQLAWSDSFFFGQPEAVREGDTCVCLESLPADATTITVSWEDGVYDPTVFVCLSFGMFLMIYSQSLQESETFHAVLGGVTALVLWTMAFSWWIVRNMKRTISGVPVVGGVFSFMFVTAFATLPSLRSMLNPFRNLTVLKDWLWGWLNLHDPFGYDLPIGWILTFAFLVVALVAIRFGARWSMSFFASPPDPEGDVAFTIGEDGRRIDILPPTPWSQWCLGCLIWLIGLVIVSRSTYSTACSLTFACLLVLRSRLIKLALEFCSCVCSCVGCSRRSQMTPDDLRPLVSLETFDSQTKLHTTNAIQRLRDFIKSHPEMYSYAGNDQSELRLRRFSEGGPHVRVQNNEDFDTFSFRSTKCTVL